MKINTKPTIRVSETSKHLDTNKTRNLNDYDTKLKRKQIFIRLEKK